MPTDLEAFVSAEGRDEKIAQVRKQIDDLGITYVYYQFPSVTGRIMGKGVPAPHWETIAGKGFQLVYGATANLFTDRHGNYIGYGPEAAELVGVPEPETFMPLPWDERVARVWVTCFRNREEREDPGAFLTSDCRANLKQDPGRLRGGHGPPPSRRHRAGDDVAQARRQGRSLRRGQDEALLLPHRPVRRAPADHPQGDRVRPGDGPGHDPGRPRGRARADRAQLRLRPGGADGRQPLDVPPDLQAGGARARRLPVLHAEAVHGRLGERLPPQHLALARRRERVRSRTPTTGRSRARSASTRSAGSWSTSPRSRP